MAALALGRDQGVDIRGRRRHGPSEYQNQEKVA